MPTDLDIPATRVAAFLRQHTHDVRNTLNGMDLEAALLSETVTDEEGREGVTRLRQQIRTAAEQLRSLSARFQEPRPHLAPIAVSELMLIWREQLSGLTAPLQVVWGEKPIEGKVDVDPAMIAELFHELFSNAASFRATGPIHATVRRDGAEVIFELREPKCDPVDVAGWGEIPFTTTRRGGYGLGLWTARKLAEANRAMLSRECTPDKILVTQLRLPLSTPER